MFKIFGFNVLKDWELEKYKNDQWENFKKYLKIKELWYIQTTWLRKPKCNACDDKRQLTITMPDGSQRKVNCSCDTSVKLYDVAKVKEKCIIAIKDEKIYMSQGFSEYSILHNIIFNESQFKNFDNLDTCFFTSKKLALKALKKIRENN